MKKQNIFYTLLFCMMAVVVSFASCSDDDDNQIGNVPSQNEGDNSSQTEQSPFVGSWVNSEDKNDTFVFNSDGTFANYYKEDGTTWVYNGTYQYNASTKTLRITFTYTNDDDVDNPTETYRVASISKNSITLVDSDGDTVTLVRTK